MGHCAAYVLFFLCRYRRVGYPAVTFATAALMKRSSFFSSMPATTELPKDCFSLSRRSRSRVSTLPVSVRLSARRVLASSLVLSRCSHNTELVRPTCSRSRVRSLTCARSSAMTWSFVFGRAIGMAFREK